MAYRMNGTKNKKWFTERSTLFQCTEVVTKMCCMHVEYINDAMAYKHGVD